MLQLALLLSANLNFLANTTYDSDLHTKMEWEADEKEEKAAGAELLPDGRRGLRIIGRLRVRILLLLPLLYCIIFKIKDLSPQPLCGTMLAKSAPCGMPLVQLNPY